MAPTGGKNGKLIPCYHGDQSETSRSTGRDRTPAREVGHASHRRRRDERRQGGHHRVEERIDQEVEYMDDERQHYLDKDVPDQYMDESEAEEQQHDQAE